MDHHEAQMIAAQSARDAHKRLREDLNCVKARIVDLEEELREAHEEIRESWERRLALSTLLTNLGFA